MQVSITYSDISEKIIGELKKAQSEVLLAVAWLTDEDIIREITHLAEAGVTVRIAISNVKENFKTLRPLKEFIRGKGELFVYTEKLLHHKFCVIDQNVILNGSYNWSYAAKGNEENIMILIPQMDNKTDRNILTSLTTRHNRLCQKGYRVSDTAMLNEYKATGLNVALMQEVIDEAEIQLRQQFQDKITATFQKAKSLNLDLSDKFLETMIRDGGGVEFVKRILKDEMRDNKIKSGFLKLLELTPPRTDLSLEHQVLQPEFATLFTEEEKTFCRNLLDGIKKD